MKNLKPDVQNEIIRLARKCGITELILFGSRARGDNSERSDIDLAVRGGKCALFSALLEDVRTLLCFDVVNLDGPVQPELLNAIEKEGDVLYRD